MDVDANYATGSPQPLLRRSIVAATLMIALLCCFSDTVSGQSASASLPNAPQPSYAGSVPSGPASDEELQLSLGDAIAKALRYNLDALEGGQNARLARGQKLIALSAILPQVSAGASENVNQESLSTLGIKVPGIPQIVGPYSYSTLDVSVSQSLFSYPAIQRLRAARTAEQAAQLSHEDILDVVTLTVGNAYLQVIEADSRIRAQEAEVRNAKALYDQALDELHAGTAPQIDVTRTEVQWHTEEYNLSIARNNFAIAKLTLGRAIGLPLGQQFELTDILPYADLTPPSLADALDTAYRFRSDYKSAVDSERSAHQELSAAKGERYPRIDTSANYADEGTTFGHSHGTFAFEAGVSVPIFTGRRISGDIVKAKATLDERKSESENLRGQIDFDVRSAYLNLNAAKEQVAVAQQNVTLAQDNLVRSKDRFSSGVTDSVEVVQAEQSLASADDQYITSLYNHNLAKLSLARALGVARTGYNQYLGGQ
jgi:outer membrane protein TolC